MVGPEYPVLRITPVNEVVEWGSQHSCSPGIDCTHKRHVESPQSTGQSVQARSNWRPGIDRVACVV